MQLTKEILERYYNGTCSEKEQQLVEAWLNKSEKVNSSHLQGFHKEVQWQAIKASITKDERRNQTNRHIILKVISIAAIALLVLLPSYYFFHSSKNNPEGKTALIAPVKWDTVISDATARKHVTLSDGTDVLLNYSSSLRIPDNFGDSTRSVFLSGEAFFKVQKDPIHPFVVHTDIGTARDLGTEFDVDAYPENGYMAITVTEGKVAFSHAKSANDLILTQGDRAVYNYLSGKISQTKTNDIWASWATGQLIFKNMRMSEIAIIIKKYYGIDVKLPSSLKTRHFTGSFQTPTLKEVARQIAFVLSCNYSINENELQFQ